MQPLIVATGMVSAFGLTPSDHAFFLRAMIPSPPASPFSTEDEEPVKVIACPLLPSALPTEGRLVALSRFALAEVDDVLAGLPAPSATPGRDRAPTSRAAGEAAKGAPPTTILLVTTAPRPGATAEDLAELEASLRARYRAPVKRFSGEAGVFVALSAAMEHLTATPRGIVVLVAVDSFVSVAYLEHLIAHPDSAWDTSKPHPAEGAAALLLVGPAYARELGLAPLAKVTRSAAAVGVANDENDEPIDPSAMTDVLDAIGDFRVTYAFGQGAFDTLRVREWHGAMARRAYRFREGHFEDCLERRVGRMGAASGAMSLVYGLAALRHRTVPLDAPPTSPMIAWAISRDGTRGAAVVELAR